MTEQIEGEEPEKVEESQETPAEPENPLGELKIPEKPQKPEGIDTETLSKIGTEVVQNGGKITDEQYEALAKAGFGDRGLVDRFFAGEMALREQQKASVYQQLGGQEKVQAALQWAADNLTAEQISELNADLGSATAAGQARIIKGLIADMGGGAPALKGSASASPSNSAPFKTLDEFHAAIQDPRYKTDKAYQASVEKRLAASNIRARTR